MDSPDLDSLVTTTLNNSLPQTAVSLGTVCQRAEDQILEVAVRSLMDAVEILAELEKLRFVRSSDSDFQYDGEQYELRTSRPENEPHVLIIAVASINPHSQLLEEPVTVKLDSKGRFAELRLKSTHRFQSHQETWATALKKVFEGGYRWLAELVRTTLDSSEDRAARELYSSLRTLFSEKVVDNIWLYAIVDERGIYIPDTLARLVASDRASKRVMRTSKSPLEVVVEFCTRVLDYEDLFSKRAIREDRTILGEVQNAPYAGSGIQVSEEVIMELELMVIQPLVRDGKTLLVAGYPTHLRDTIESVLTNERERFRQIIDRGATALRRIVRTAEQNGLDPETQGKSYLERLLERAEWLEFKPRIAGIGIGVDGKHLIGEAAKYWRSRRERKNKP